MPFHYKPAPRGLDPCPIRDQTELEEAAKLLGDTAVLGSELSFELRSLNVNPINPSRAPAGMRLRQPFVQLQAMLVAERWLIEFLTGPALIDRNTPKQRKRVDDICVDCFVHDWRLPPGELADELVTRRDRINRLAAHATWKQITLPPRHWTLNRIGRCVEGLAIFAVGVRPDHPSIAAMLEDRIDSTR